MFLWNQLLYERISIKDGNYECIWDLSLSFPTGTHFLRGGLHIALSFISLHFRDEWSYPFLSKLSLLKFPHDGFCGYLPNHSDSSWQSWKRLSNPKENFWQWQSNNYCHDKNHANDEKYGARQPQLAGKTRGATCIALHNGRTVSTVPVTSIPSCWEYPCKYIVDCPLVFLVKINHWHQSRIQYSGGGGSVLVLCSS